MDVPLSRASVPRTVQRNSDHSRADFCASRHRIPSRVGPFDFRFLRHFARSLFVDSLDSIQTNRKQLFIIDSRILLFAFMFKGVEAVRDFFWRSLEAGAAAAGGSIHHGPETLSAGICRCLAFCRLSAGLSTPSPICGSAGSQPVRLSDVGPGGFLSEDAVASRVRQPGAPRGGSGSAAECQIAVRRRQGSLRHRHARAARQGRPAGAARRLQSGSRQPAEWKGA